MAYEYNALLKEGLQKKTAGAFPSGVVATVDEVNSLQGVTGNVQTQLNNLHSDSKDIDVSTLEEFNTAIASASATNSIRVHLRANISLTSNASYNLNYVQIIGHDFTLNLNNYTFTITGQTCSFYQIRIAATLTTTAESAGDYENARIIINSNVASSRFFFEYVVFRNFINFANEVNDIIWVSNISGASPSLHLYFMFTEVMTNYQEENINSGVWCVNNISNRLHALTVHNIDFWGPAPGENNQTLNFAFRGFSLSGAAKLAYIQDGSSVLNTTVSEALTPNFVNQYNPSFQEFNALKFPNSININNILIPSRVTGSGNYIEFFIPCPIPYYMSNKICNININYIDCYYNNIHFTPNYSKVEVNISYNIGVSCLITLTNSRTANETHLMSLSASLNFS